MNAANRARSRRPHNPKSDIPQEQFSKLSQETKRGWVREDLSLREEVITAIRNDGKDASFDTAANSPPWKRPDLPPWKRPNPTRSANTLSLSTNALQDFFSVNKINSEQDFRDFHSFVSGISSDSGTSTDDSGGECRFKICEVNNASSNKAGDEQPPAGAISKILKAKKGTTLSLTDNNKVVKKITVNNIDLSPRVDDTDDDGEKHPDFASPPLRTQFGPKANRQAMYVENDRRSIPYQAAGPLSPAC